MPLMPQLAFILSSLYRPMLDIHDFHVVIDDTYPILYKKMRFNPSVIHFPGGEKNTQFRTRFISQWDTLTSTLLQESSIRILQLNNYSDIDKYKNPGEYFLRKNKLPYTIKGKKTSPAEWRNSKRLAVLYDWLCEQSQSGGAKYFLFFDSADAILMRSPGYLIGALEEYQCKIIFGMDSIIYNGYGWRINLLHPPSYMKHYKNKHYRFLNAGMIFGEIRAMRDCLSLFLLNLEKGMHSSDQHYYHQLYAQNPHKIGVDYKRKYLLNIFPFESFFEEKQLS